MINPSTRRVAHKLRQAGRAVSHETIRRWQANGWRPLARERHPLDAARAALGPDAVFLTRRQQLVGLSLRHAVPTLYPWREAIEIGGLMSYGSALAGIFHQVGIYTGRILKGEKPADLPIMRASKFELVINLQTARTIGVTVPPTLLASADEVVE
jgi:putative ABC transport system substrate-binding protein